jgi:SAM-dependent methyltransferase
MGEATSFGAGTAFMRAPYSYDNGFPCFHRKTHATDSSWFDTLNPQQWAELVKQQSAGQRHKIDELMVPTMQRYGIRPGAKVLAIGCGMGFDVLRLRHHGYDAIGCDFGGRTKAWLENGLTPEIAFLADAEDLPLADDSFDAVYLWHVIEHFGCIDGNQIVGPNVDGARKKIVERIRSILKPGGICVVGTPNRLFPLDQYHGPHLYLPKRLRDWACSRSLGLHYFWSRRDFLLSRRELKLLFSTIGHVEWLSLSIGLALSKGVTHKDKGPLLERYAQAIDSLGLSTSFLSPALHLVAQK